MIPGNDKLKAKVCAFDAYGTLFDFNPVAIEESIPSDRAAALRDLWRTKQLQYFWASTLQGAYRDFESLTADALDFAIEALHLDQPGLHDALMAQYARLRPYPEIAGTLGKLKSQGFRIVIHTNATMKIVTSSLVGAELTDFFDEIVSIDAVRHYKPHPVAYRYLVDRLNVQVNEIAFISSNGWDAFGAAQFGLSSIWVNRTNGPRERLSGRPTYVVSDVGSLPDILLFKQ